MRKNIFIYGSIIGAILVANMIYVVNLCYTDYDFSSNNLVGYAAMVVVLSLIFFGVRNFRNKRNNGFITFGQAFKMGSLIALLSATLYVVAWLFYYYLFVPDFIDVYIPHVLREATADGATAAELAEKTKEMEQFREMYKNPLFVVLITYFEVLPVGIVVALISSLILKKKQASAGI
jgi:hypothetical protein